jgi:hypothetical protein
MANSQSNSGLDQCHDCGVRRKQVANPTTNYGFVLPTPTDLVTDLPADFDVALQGVDTRLKALQPGTTLGDLAYSSATANTNTRLAIGTSGQVLAVSGGGIPAWTTTADVTPLTTKGDLFTFTTVDARLGVGTNGQTLVADSAEATGLKWATPTSSSFPTFSAYKSGGTQTFSTATWTKITFATESWDEPGCFASSTFTPTSAGYYSINTGLYHTQVSNGDFHIAIYKNGSAWQRLTSVGTIAGVSELHGGQSLVYCNGTTDYIEIYAKGDNGGNVSISDGATLTYFSGIGIRA